MNTIKSSAKRHAGFTLVELLTVIAIIGVLIALLMPAVQFARETARRMACGNKLEQLGIALHHYHDSHNSFPPGAIWGAPQANGALPELPYHHTWIRMLLPYLEEKALDSKVDNNRRAWGQTILVDHKLEALLCPSDGVFERPIQTHQMAITNYAGCEGFDFQLQVLDRNYWIQNLRIDVPGPPGNYSGVFTPLQTTRLADIKDGTSNTIMVAEVNSTGFKQGAKYSAGTGLERRPESEAIFRSAFVATGYEGPCCSGRFSEVDGSGVKMPQTWFRTNPNSYAPTYLSAWGPNSDWPGASSRHPALVQALRADGGVDQIKDSISIANWIMLNGKYDRRQANGGYRVLP